MTGPLFHRAHLYVPLVDERGDLHPYVQVRLYLQDGQTPYTGPIYRDALSDDTWINPHTAAPALIDLYLPGPEKLVLGLKFAADAPETLSHVYEVLPHGEDMVRAPERTYVTGASDFAAVLCTDGTDGFWKPLRFPHEHATVAPGGIRTGTIPTDLAQAGAFDDTTAVGVRAGGSSAHSSLRRATALGLEARVGGRGGTALGAFSSAAESPTAPWSDGGVAIGRAAVAQGSGVALGVSSTASDAQVAIGRATSGTGSGAVSLGAGARAGQQGLALGSGTGTSARGNPGSIGLGAGAQYGLPGDTGHTAVLLGAHDGSVRTTSYPNPDASQSESPWEEFAPTLGFAADTVQLQRHLTWLIDVDRLDVHRHATVGGREANLGFYGATPRTRATIADDEPCTGIPALDNLIYALRDLGLLGYRTEALLDYRAADLLPRYRDGDVITAWPEHFGRDVALAVDPTAGPTLREHDWDMHGRATAAFFNAFYCRRAAPLQQMRAPVLLPFAKHFIAVAEHNDDFGEREGLVNLHSGTNVAADQVLTSADYRRNRWSGLNIGHYERDGLDQSANLRAHPDLDHVHQVTATTVWPHGSPILGGPRDETGQGSPGDSWSGSVAEIVALDSSWTPEKARSMSVGLGFLYGVKQDDRWIDENARDFLITQHDPRSGVYLFWDDDYADSYHGRVWGSVRELPAPIRHRSYIDLQDADRVDYDGPLCGYWYDVSSPLDCEVIVLCRQGDWDDDDETDEVFGPFALNNSGTWSMGDLWCRPGRKRCYVRRRDNHSVICRSWDRRDDCGEDVAVRVYSVTGGVETLEDTVPLWGDRTFSARVRHSGHKVARIYDGATLIGSTDWQEQGLPRSLVFHPSDPDVDPEVVGDRAHTYEVALAVLAFTEMDTWWDRRRARTILGALRSVQAVDGSLKEWYLGTEADQGSGGNIDLHAMSWVILAVLRYQQVTGDGQFLTFATKLGDYLKGAQIGSGPGQGSLRGFAHTAGATNL
jgi:hypothetical protein